MLCRAKIFFGAMYVRSFLVDSTATRGENRDLGFQLNFACWPMNA